MTTASAEKAGPPPPYGTSAALPSRLAVLEEIAFGPEHSVATNLPKRVEALEQTLGIGCEGDLEDQQNKPPKASLPQRIQVLEEYLIG